MNEMVSTADAEIILHIWSPRFRASRDGEYSGVTTENTQSAKIFLNFNFLGGGGLWSHNWKYSKCQDLPKFNFRGGGGGLSGEFGHKFFCLRLVYRNLLVHHR